MDSIARIGVADRRPPETMSWFPDAPKPKIPLMKSEGRVMNEETLFERAVNLPEARKKEDERERQGHQLPAGRGRGE